MADIAEIGFKADSSQLKEANATLQTLAPTATAAAKATDTLNTSLTATGSAATKAAAGLETEAKAAGVAAVATGKQTKAANDNAHAHQAMSTQAMAMQHSLRSSIEMLAMGIAPTQILASQMNHLTYAMSGEGGLQGALSSLGTSLKGLLNPVNLLGVGLFGLSITLLTMVNWASAAKTALNEFANILPKIAPYLVGIGIAMAIAFGPQILAMITAVSEAVLGLTARLIGLAIGFAAANPATAFILGIALIITALNAFRNEIAQIFGVDVIGFVKQVTNTTIGAFVGAYEGIVATWKQLPAAFADLGIQAANALISAIQSAVNKTIDAMRSLWNWIADHDPTGTMQHNNAKANVDLGQIPNQYSGAASGVADQINKIAADAQKVDYVGIAIDHIGKAANTAAGYVRKLADGIDATDSSGKKKAAKKDPFAEIVTGANNTIEKLNAEKNAVGLTAEAAARLKYETQLLNEANSKGITLTAAQREQLIGLAHDMASLEVATAKAKEQLAFTKDLFSGFVSDLESGLKNGEGFWKSFGNAALNVLNKIVDKLLTDVINALFEVSQVGGSSPGSSASGLLGGLFSLFGFAKGGSFDGGVQRFAKGSQFTNSVVTSPTMFKFANGSKFGEMGEAGPEAVVPLKRMGNGDLGVQMAAPQGNANDNAGDGRVRTLNVNVSGARGNAEISDMVKQGVEQGISQFNDYALPARVNEIAEDRRKR